MAEARELWGAKVAEQLWAKLGLGKAPVAEEVEEVEKLPEPPDGPGEAAVGHGQPHAAK